MVISFCSKQRSEREVKSMRAHLVVVLLLALAGLACATPLFRQEQQKWLERKDRYMIKLNCIQFLHLLHFYSLQVL